MKEKIIMGLCLGGILGILAYFIFESIQMGIVFGGLMFMSVFMKRNQNK